MLTETARLPEWLSYRLKHSPLLFVRCHIPDWVGRFLVRFTSKTRLALAGHQIFIVGSELARQPGLAAFFTTFCGSTRVQALDADPVSFITELGERWEKRNPPTATRTPATAAEAASTRGGIFISYVREDVAAARQLGNTIASIGGDVWLDERRLHPGDRWETEILESIRREVRLFVPLISKHTERREEEYVFKEWGDAVARAKRIPRRHFIVPIVIDADFDGDPERYRQLPEDFSQLHFGRAPDGVPDRMLIEALTAEIRAMRRSEAV
jgi:TIR domain-containing protein